MGSAKRRKLSSAWLPIVLRILRAKLFLHELQRSLAAVGEGGFQQVAAFGQGIHMDGLKAVFHVHHLFAVHAEDFHLLQVFSVEIEGLGGGVGPNAQQCFAVFAKAGAI